MVSLKEAGWRLNGLGVVILGEAKDTTPFQKRMTTKPSRQPACSLKMYTVHFLNVPPPWGGKGYDPVPEKDEL